jgi:predicted MPP superfamily phosphohydrolase
LDGGVKVRALDWAAVAGACRKAGDLDTASGTDLEITRRCGCVWGGRFPRRVSTHPTPSRPRLTHGTQVDRAAAPVLSFLEAGNTMRTGIYIIAALALVVCYAAIVEPTWLKVRTYEVLVPGLATDITLVHIADIHTKEIGFRERRTLEIIEGIDPDFVLVSGDLLKSDSKLKVGLTFLSGLHARQGVYFVPGNSDYALIRGLETGEVPRAFGNWHILMNESVDCGPFVLVGLDDPVRCRENVARSFLDVDGTKPVFVMAHFHAKRVLAALREHDVDLIFTGHTHGGQIGLGPLVTYVPYAHRSKYVAGFYSVDGARLYVTRGVGTNIFPLRLNCRPEIAVFHLRGA